MAVSVTSSPPVSPNIISASHPVVITMSSTVYGTPNVTQHRFIAEVSTLFDLGKKVTVVYSGSTGKFDLSDTFKSILYLSQNRSGAIPLTQMVTIYDTEAFWSWTYQVVIKEQYYLSGVFTENTGPTLLFKATRGFTNDATFIWKYANWFEFNGLRNFMPYSGKIYQVYPVQVNGTLAGWPPDSTHPYMNISLDSLPGIIGNWWFTRNAVGYQGVVYVPLYWPGFTDSASSLGIKLTIGVSTTSGPGPGYVLVQTIYIYRNVYPCEDPEYNIMFIDRFYQWSFMSFSKKSRVQVNTTNQLAEAPTGSYPDSGRYRYNVEASETLTLNTDWMNDNQNELLKDLIATPRAYLVSPTDGSLEQVTVVPNSLQLQTSRNDGVFQYSMSFRKSVDNFAP